MPLYKVYRDILVCSQERYFRVHHTTHTKGQPQSDPMKCYYTGDVVAMSFRTSDEQKAIEWLLPDSPRTPKCIVADAEKSSNSKVIEEKVKSSN